MGDEGGLHRMQFVAARDAFDGEDVGAVMADRQSQAGIDPPAVDQHRAGAALAAVAALLGAGQMQALAQQIEQRDAGSSSSTSRRTPLTVRLMEKFMQGSDQCYGRIGSRGRRRRVIGEAVQDSSAGAEI